MIAIYTRRHSVLFSQGERTHIIGPRYDLWPSCPQHNPRPRSNIPACRVFCLFVLKKEISPRVSVESFSCSQPRPFLLIPSCPLTMGENYFPLLHTFDLCLKAAAISHVFNLPFKAYAITSLASPPRSPFIHLRPLLSTRLLLPELQPAVRSEHEPVLIWIGQHYKQRWKIMMHAPLAGKNM